MCHQTDISSRVTSCGKKKSLFRWPNLMGNVLKSRRRLPSAVSLFVLGPQMGRKLKMNDRRAGTEELPLQKRESLSGSHSQWERLSLHKKGKKKMDCAKQERGRAQPSSGQQGRENSFSILSGLTRTPFLLFHFSVKWNTVTYYTVIIHFSRI